MVTIRDFTPSDIPALEKAIAADQFHPGEWKVWHFTIPHVMTKVVEDSKGPLAFVLYTPDDGRMRISCVWADTNPKRNARGMLAGIPQMIETAKRLKYDGIVIETQHRKLADFFTHAFNMERSGDDYLLTFDKETPCAAPVRQ